MRLFVGLLWERLWVPTQVPSQPGFCWLFGWGHRCSWVSLCFTCFSQNWWFFESSQGIKPANAEVGCRGNLGFLPAKAAAVAGCSEQLFWGLTSCLGGLTQRCGWLSCSLWVRQEVNIPKMCDSQVGRSVLTPGRVTVRHAALNCSLAWLHHRWFWCIYVFFCECYGRYSEVAGSERAPGAFPLFSCKMWSLPFTCLGC